MLTLIAEFVEDETRGNVDIRSTLEVLRVRRSDIGSDATWHTRNECMDGIALNSYEAPDSNIYGYHDQIFACSVCVPCCDVYYYQ